MEFTPVSVVIITKNESGRIADCIRSAAAWADEIIVVDDESSDDTITQAKNLGAHVCSRKMEIEGRHRNWAYQQAKNDWVFSLDADERLTAQLKEEISLLLKGTPEHAAYTVPRKNHLADYWIRWGGMYPAPQIKLFRKQKFKWEEVEVHPRAFLEGTCGHLTGDLIHYTYRDWTDFLRKLNTQTTLEAKKWIKVSRSDPRKAAYKMNTLHALWRTADRFFRAFIAKKGYRDGFIGFMVAYFSSLYQIVSYAKYRWMKTRGDF
ncbi:MAG: glycosyltransferase family 2 protein [Candidatus Omnitrophica bacterium]|nr:glycosyltransferase family 2 protein [Candidatus Omnitrophota bacterium]